jgi:hypothetical protein
LTTVHTVKSKGEISQNFVAFSEDMNFKKNENQANRIENPSAVWIDFCDLDTIFRYGHWAKPFSTPHVRLSWERVSKKKLSWFVVKRMKLDHNDGFETNVPL